MKLTGVCPQSLLSNSFRKDLRAFLSCLASAALLPLAVMAIAQYGYGLEGTRPLVIGVLSWIATVMLLGTVYMLTHYKRLRGRLVPLAEQASIAEVSATVAHDLRSPLTSLQTAIRYFDASLDDPERLKQCITLATMGAQRIESISQDYLDALERKTKEREVVNVRHVVQTLITEYQSRADLGRMHFIVRAEGAQFNVDGIATHLERTLANLMGNAMEAMKLEGDLQISLRQHQGQVEVSIADSGCGMSTEQAVAIESGDIQTKGKRHGHGLGLQFVHQTLRSHQGTMRAESIEGQGTTFTLSFPVSAQPQATVIPLKKAVNSE